MNKSPVGLTRKGGVRVNRIRASPNTAYAEHSFERRKGLLLELKSMSWTSVLAVQVSKFRQYFRRMWTFVSCIPQTSPVLMRKLDV